MRAGPTPDAVVSTPTATVTLAGKTAEVDNVEVRRQIVSDLPQHVVGGGGIRSATGTVNWSALQTVSTQSSSPWALTGVPQPGTLVGVVMGTAEDGTCQKFTGLIDSSSGQSGESVSSELLDHIDRMNRTASVEPLLAVMPPITPGGELRRIGVMAEYAANLAMRACGYYTTPPVNGSTVLSVPAQGSIWPELGTVTAATAADTYPSVWSAPWGLSTADFTATFTPDGGQTPTAPLLIGLAVPGTHAGIAHATARYGAGGTVRLHVRADRRVTAFVGGVEVAFIAPSTDPWVRVTLLVKNGVVTLSTDTGLTATGSGTPSGTSALSSVDMVADAASRVAGLQVGHPATTAEETAYTDFVPNARIRKGQLGGYLTALPRVEPTMVLSLLSNISKATLSPFWLDEDGVLQWAQSDVLRNQVPVVTLTAKDSLYSIGWETALAHARSIVEVKSGSPIISASTAPNITVWEGRGEELLPGQVSEDVVSAPSGEDWIMVDETLSRIGSDPAGFNQGWGTWVGGIITPDPETIQWAGIELSVTLSRLRDNVYVVSHTAAASTTGTIYLKTPDAQAVTAIWRQWRGRGMPIIRAHAKVKWLDVTETSTITGPDDAPALIHDAGRWVQRSAVGWMADYLAEHATKPTPVITGLEVVPDHRVQLGDVVRILDPDDMGVDLTGLVVDVASSVSEGQSSMRLGLRVVTASQTLITYDQLAGVDETYDQLTARTGTYDEFAANPLGGIA